MVKMTLIYADELSCVATHGPSGNTLTTDAPVDNCGKGESFSPTDLVATGLGSCMATIMGIIARRHGWDLKGMRVEVTKEMTGTAPRRIKRLTTELWIPLPRSADPNRLLERGAMTCPVHHSLHPAIEKPVIIHWADDPGSGSGT